MQKCLDSILEPLCPRQYFQKYPKARMVLAVQKAQLGSLYHSEFEKYGFLEAGLNAKFFRCVSLGGYSTRLICISTHRTVDKIEITYECCQALVGYGNVLKRSVYFSLQFTKYKTQ